MVSPRQNSLLDLGCRVRAAASWARFDCDADINTARQVIFEAVAQIKGVEPEPPPPILVQELAPSTVQLEVRFWVNSRRQSFLQVTSEASQAIKESLQAAGIEMPTEIYTIT